MKIFIAALLALIMCAALVACDSGNTPDLADTTPADNVADTTPVETEETKVFYNDDGSISHEEVYYPDGTLKKKVTYDGIRAETYYAEDGVPTKEIMYYVECSTVCEYNAEGYWGKVTQYDSSNSAIQYYEMEYNEYGALSVYKIYNSWGTLVREAHLNTEGITEAHKHSVSLSPVGGISIIDPAVDFVQSGENWTQKYNYGKIISDYFWDGKGQLTEQVSRVTDASGEVIIKSIRYRNGEYSYEEWYNKDLVRIKYIAVDNSGQKTTREFDTNGKEIGRKSEDAQGNLIEEYEYKRDENGDIFKEIKYNSDYTITYYIDFTYENGKKVKEEKYEKGEYLSAVSTYEYDETGGYKKITNEYYTSGNLSREINETYDASGNQLTSRVSVY